MFLEPRGNRKTKRPAGVGGIVRVLCTLCRFLPTVEIAVNLFLIITFACSPLQVLCISLHLNLQPMIPKPSKIGFRGWEILRLFLLLSGSHVGCSHGSPILIRPKLPNMKWRWRVGVGCRPVTDSPRYVGSVHSLHGSLRRI